MLVALHKISVLVLTTTLIKKYCHVFFFLTNKLNFYENHQLAQDDRTEVVKWKVFAALRL